MNDELLELVGQVEDALAWLRSAETTAGNMLTDERTGEPIPWKEMEMVADGLGKAYNILVNVLEPVADAIKTAREDQDHQEDLWDAQRL